MRGFKIAHGALAKKIRAAKRQMYEAERKRASIPPRIPVGQREGGNVVKLSTERKHLTNLIKMVASQAESDLA